MGGGGGGGLSILQSGHRGVQQCSEGQAGRSQRGRSLLGIDIQTIRPKLGKLQ